MTSKKKRRQARRRWKGSSGLLLVGIISIAAIVAAIALMAFGGDGEGSERRPVRAPMVVSEEQQVTIEVVDSDYEPRNLTIRPGTEVTWEFTGSLPHTVTDPAGAFDSGTLGRGDTFKMTFDDPGQYSYYCVLHHVMQATLVVAAATPATQE